VDERALITEVSREERGEAGDEQREGAEPSALRASLSSGGHALSPGADTAQASGPPQPFVPGHKRRGGDNRRFHSHQLGVKAMRTSRKGSVEMPGFMRQLVKETEKRVSSFFKGGRGGAAEGEQPADGEGEEVIPSPYLDRPVLDKLTEEGCARWGLTYALGSMQGWRAHMEDFHNCVPQLGGELADWSFFAVFDGHAGSTVAQYCSRHLLGRVLATGEQFTTENA